jgi:hypothetical protein
MHEVCDNSRCIAIEHLKVGTRLENERHKWQVGRGVMPRYEARGEQNGNAKLTAQQVAAIRRAARRVSQRTLAQRYHVTEQAISLIVLGRTWRHLAAGRVGGMHGEPHPPSSQPAGAPHDARAQPARGDRTEPMRSGGPEDF